MTYTPYLGGTLLVPGQDAPENAVNALAAILAKGVAGRLSVNLGSLSGSQFASLADSPSRVFSFTGTQSGAVTYHLRVDSEQANNLILVYNGSAGDVTVKLSADGSTSAGTGTVVPLGGSRLLWHDGTNVYPASPSLYRSTGGAEAARVTNSAVISIPNTTATVLTFDTERRDDGSLHSTSSNTDRLVAPVAGWYQVAANVEFASNATGFRTLSLRKNGSATSDIIWAAQANAVSGTDTILQVCCVVYLAAGDYVSVYAYQSSGGSLNVQKSGQYSPEFAMARVG